MERQVAERGEWGEWRGGQAKVDRGMADTDRRFICRNPTGSGYVALGSLALAGAAR